MRQGHGLQHEQGYEQGHPLLPCTKMKQQADGTHTLNANRRPSSSFPGSVTRLGLRKHGIFPSTLALLLAQVWLGGEEAWCFTMAMVCTMHQDRAVHALNSRWYR
eukprot:262387-Pelagomonas_calceolata.AAC.1